MYNLLGETYRIAYGDLCFFRRHIAQVVVSSMIGPLLYLIAFGYGMRSGSTGGLDVSYLAYVIPGIVSITTLTAGFASSSQKILIQREFFTSFDELILSPMHVPSIIFGKSVIGCLKGLVGAGIMLGLGMLLEPDVHISLQLIAVILFCCVTFSLLGVMAGLLAHSTPTLNMISSVVILPMTFMCGTLFAVDSLPSWASAIIKALPLTHSSEMIRSCALELDFPRLSLAILGIYFVAFFAVDYVIIRRKLY